MNVDLDGLIPRLEDIAGSGHVTVNPEIQLGSLRPGILVNPGSEEEIAHCLRICQEASASVIPAGAASWLGGGNPLNSADVILSLRRLNQIVEYSPPDLTATLQSGTALSEFNLTANQRKQWLPLDPPGGTASTIGAIVACGSSGTLRFGFGTPRDYVLGLSLAHSDGTISKSGGKVVKNVAGYDLNKLYTGSFGTLAVITGVTVKLRPLPEHSSTSLIVANDGHALFEYARRLLAAALRPASVFVINRALMQRLGLAVASPGLLVRFLDNENTVNYEAAKVASLAEGQGRIEVLQELNEARSWDALTNLDIVADICLKLSVPMSQTETAAELCAATVPHALIAVDAAAGIVRAAFNAESDAGSVIQKLRSELNPLRGALFIEKAPMEIKSEVGAWNDPGPTARIMREIKNKLDPKGILNPGRFVGGI